MIMQLRRALTEIFGKKQKFLLLNFGKKQRVRLPEFIADSFELHLSAFKGPMP